MRRSCHELSSKANELSFSAAVLSFYVMDGEPPPRPGPSSGMGAPTPAWNTGTIKAIVPYIAVAGAKASKAVYLREVGR